MTEEHMSEGSAHLRDKIRKACRDSWRGATGEQRAVEVDALLDRVLPQYAKVLGISEDRVLAAIEERRSYHAPGYYQEANFPDLDNVAVFQSRDEMMASLQPERGFRCPACGGVSKDYQTCDSGDKTSSGKVCDWKAYGLFRTMGKGLRVVVAEGFLENPRVHELFMPIAREAAVTE